MPDRRLVLTCLLALIPVVRSRPAAAHAILLSSTPQMGGSVPSGALRVHLTFNSRIDGERSLLTLTRPDQTRVTLPLDPQTAPETLTAPATLTPGAHVLRWQVLALDGHVTRGDLPFSVTGG